MLLRSLYFVCVCVFVVVVVLETVFVTGLELIKAKLAIL